MRWFLRHFWRSLAAIGTLIGILYLPVNIRGLPDATRPIRDTLMLLEREWLLLAWVVIVTGLVIWQDARKVLPEWPRLRFSRDERRELSRRSLALADRLEKFRAAYVREGQITDETFYSAVRGFRDLVALEKHLRKKGIGTFFLPSRLEDDIPRLIDHAQLLLVLVGTMLPTATAKEIRRAIAEQQQAIHELYQREGHEASLDPGSLDPDFIGSDGGKTL